MVRKEPSLNRAHIMSDPSSVAAFPGAPKIRSPHGIEAVRSKSRTWNGVTVHALEIQVLPSRAWIDLTSDQVSLSIVLEVMGGRVETRQTLDMPNPAHHQAPRPISLIPAGMTLWGHAEGSRRVREARLDFDFAALEPVLGEELDRQKFQTPRLTFHDDRIWRMGELLATQCEAPDSLTQLYGDSLTTALFIDLLRMGKRSGSERKQGGLAPWQLRRAKDYIEAHLSDAVRLQDLAQLTGLSQSQFGRAFKASTGMTPFRWQTQTRIARARELLLAGRLSIAQVSLATGFSEQSHFTRVFQRVVGTSPGAWRREQRG
jgi:AraC family transcriptional regulator